jgi:hypothetical protein
MKRGVVAQFAAACSALAPLGDVSGTSDEPVTLPI